jgi:hypothetical protein
LPTRRSGLHQQWLSFGLAPGHLDEFLAAVRGHGI